MKYDHLPIENLPFNNINRRHKKTSLTRHSKTKIERFNSKLLLFGDDMVTRPFVWILNHTYNNRDYAKTEIT